MPAERLAAERLNALTHILNVGEWLVGPIDRLVADAGHRALPDVVVEDTAHLLAAWRRARQLQP